MGLARKGRALDRQGRANQRTGMDWTGVAWLCVAGQGLPKGEDRSGLDWRCEAGPGRDFS